jgi:hypothetical protein
VFLDGKNLLFPLEEVDYAIRLNYFMM